MRKAGDTGQGWGGTLQTHNRNFFSLDYGKRKKDFMAHFFRGHPPAGPWDLGSPTLGRERRVVI